MTLCNFCFFKILPPVLKLLSGFFVDLTRIPRLSLLSTLRALLNYLGWSRSISRWRFRLICHVAWALFFWLFSIDFPMERRRRKLIRTVGASRAIFVMKILEFMSWVQKFIFLKIILTIHASNKPTKVSSCQMGDSLWPSLNDATTNCMSLSSGYGTCGRNI